MTWGGVDQPGHLQITGQIKGAFKTVLEERGIKLEFTYGHWAGLAKEIKQEYDLVLTAETIYAEESVDDLIKLLQAAVGVATEQAEPASSGNKEDWPTGIAQGERIVLVAAKVRLAPPLHPCRRITYSRSSTLEWEEDSLRSCRKSRAVKGGGQTSKNGHGE
jgi:hypothetical protein